MTDCPGTEASTGFVAGPASTVSMVGPGSTDAGASL